MNFSTDQRPFESVSRSNVPAVVVQGLAVEISARLVQAGCQGGEAVVHDVVEVLQEAVGHDAAHLLRVESALLEAHVAALLDGRYDGRVGGGPAYAALLELLDEARLGVARGRAREMLAWPQGLEAEGLADLDLGEDAVVLPLLAARLRGQDSGEAVEEEDAANCISPCTRTPTEVSP